MKIRSQKPTIALAATIGAALALSAEAQNESTPPVESTPPAKTAAAAPAPQMDFGFELQNYQSRRYDDLHEKSPFEIEIVEIVEEVKEPDNFKDLAIAGYTKKGSEYFVTLVNIKTNERQRIATGQANDEGIELVGLTPGPIMKETTIQLKQGTVTGTLGFNEKRLSKAPTGSTAKPTRPTGGKAAGGKQPTRPGSTINKGKQPAQSGNQKSGQAKSSADRIKELLQKRSQSGGRNGRSGTSTQGTKKETKRRRVILPPSVQRK